MQGRRLADREFSRRLSHADGPMIVAGDYGRVRRAGEGWVWMCCTPSGHIGDLTAHTVTENADGTITVEPSIQVDGAHASGGAVGSWHGYLRAGVWSSC